MDVDGDSGMSSTGIVEVSREGLDNDVEVEVLWMASLASWIS